MGRVRNENRILAVGTKWALHGPFLDKTLLRNYLRLNLCGEVMDQWVPQARFCELLIDGKYQGVYLLMEMIEIQPDRLNLDKYQTGDIANSYVVRIEREEDSGRDIETFSGRTLRLEDDHTMELVYPGVSRQSEAWLGSAVDRNFEVWGYTFDTDTLADFCYGDDCVEVRLPWLLINMGDPSNSLVHRDYYVCHGVESLLQLDYQLFEIIVIDDGSQDDTSRVLIEHFGMRQIREPIRRSLDTKPIEAINKAPDTRVRVTLIRKPFGTSPTPCAGARRPSRLRTS